MIYVKSDGLLIFQVHQWLSIHIITFDNCSSYKRIFRFLKKYNDDLTQEKKIIENTRLDDDANWFIKFPMIIFNIEISNVLFLEEYSEKAAMFYYRCYSNLY